MRVSFEQMYQEFLRVLRKRDFSEDRAQCCARIFAESSRDGVYSHGLNRFPMFIRHIDEGRIQTQVTPELVGSFGSMERWDGRHGPGPLSAHFCMECAIELAKEHSMSCVGLRNTTHWMRGGTYGWQAADAGCLAMCFTNTSPNMPPWGGAEARIGNNPMVIAVPRKEGHLVLDMATALFSYGKMGVYRSKGEILPFDGGYDADGNLTRDPDAILKSQRPLPIGNWKGSGLTMMLDLLAAIFSDGLQTAQLEGVKIEEGVSQAFLCFDITGLWTKG